MITAWTKHLTTDQEKHEFAAYIRASKRLLERLNQLIDEQETELNRSEVSRNIYDNPNWAYLQAHNNGFRQGLAIIRKLITLDPKEK